MPTLSEPRPPFSLNKVSGALDLEVPSALQMHRCPWPSPRGRPALGPKPMNGVFVVPPLWPLEAAWYGLPPSRVPSVGGSDSGAGLDLLSGQWKGPDPLLTSGRGCACIFPQDADSPIYIRDRLIRHVAVPQTSSSPITLITKEEPSMHKLKQDSELAAGVSLGPSH